MPRIFDNIDQPLLPALQETLKLSTRADFCVGYFNLRGWRRIDGEFEEWDGSENSRVRLLVGMHAPPRDELRSAMSFGIDDPHGLDQKAILDLKKKAAADFREQLTFGSPTNEDERGLRRLSKQLKSGKVVVKLFLRHTLHAKLYLCHRADPISPTVGFLGSSNLTISGLSRQGELNVDVLDHDACDKLQSWFEDRWRDRWCLDISQDLVEIIDASWAREEPLSPYELYLKMAYHLSQEARSGLSEFRIPGDFGDELLEFQTAAVKIAAHHLNKRNGVILGDVVGLGKTLMATALARVFQDDHLTETLIVCPKNLVEMWQEYVDRYRLIARVLPLSMVEKELPSLRRYRLLIIDESHNLRNREGKRYRAIQSYVEKNECKCVLLSATPYNKGYLDLSSQLRLFVPEDLDLGMRPERVIRELSETEFLRRYQAPVRTIGAFEKSPYPEDWQDLMRLYLVRRTRSFIQENYAAIDMSSGRRYLTFADGRRFFFPARDPRTVPFGPVSEGQGADPYGHLQSQEVVDAVSGLSLPRYGLGNYIATEPREAPSPAETKTLDGLSRSGRRLMGFCRTNLFKRLESGGPAFILSLERHALRNFVFLHAIENGFDLPLGSQDASLLDADTGDGDVEAAEFEFGTHVEPQGGTTSDVGLDSEDEFRQRAAQAYESYSGRYKRRFGWIRPTLFADQLRDDLLTDARALLEILRVAGEWDSNADTKLQALVSLLTERHPESKVLIFTQYADTANYLESQLRSRGIGPIAAVTGGTDGPTQLAWRFSPRSNMKDDAIEPGSELRVLIATDVLSEGQNLQDCSIVVNFDLPWAIIRLIQRAGRVDRIGQVAETIACYSFLPTDGVERVIRLRNRVRTRLRENAEVVGADEAFFEDDDDESKLVDLYHEKSGVLDGEDDKDVDLASHAFQIWKNAVDADPSLQKRIADLPNVVYSAKQFTSTDSKPHGALVYARTSQGNDALAWIDDQGESVTESQFTILSAAQCKPSTPPAVRSEGHHQLVRAGTALIASEERTIGGQLGRPSGARFRTYERLKRYLEEVRGTIFETKELLNAVDDVYRHPLRQVAVDTLNRQLRTGISDAELAELVIGLRQDDRLTIVQEEEVESDPQIVCSMGLVAG